MTQNTRYVPAAPPHRSDRLANDSQTAIDDLIQNSRNAVAFLSSIVPALDKPSGETPQRVPVEKRAVQPLADSEAVYASPDAATSARDNVRRALTASDHDGMTAPWNAERTRRNGIDSAMRSNGEEKALPNPHDSTQSGETAASIPRRRYGTGSEGERFHGAASAQRKQGMQTARQPSRHTSRSRLTTIEEPYDSSDDAGSIDTYHQSEQGDGTDPEQGVNSIRYIRPPRPTLPDMSSQTGSESDRYAESDSEEEDFGLHQDVEGGYGDQQRDSFSYSDDEYHTASDYSRPSSRQAGVIRYPESQRYRIEEGPRSHRQAPHRHATSRQHYETADGEFHERRDTSKLAVPSTTVRQSSLSSLEPASSPMAKSSSKTSSKSSRRAAPAATRYELDAQELNSAEEIGSAYGYSEGRPRRTLETRGRARSPHSRRQDTNTDHHLQAHGDAQADDDGGQPTAHRNQDDDEAAALFRSAGAKTDPVDLIPDSSPVPQTAPGAPHLPDWDARKGPDQITSMPIKKVRYQSEMSLRKLMSEELFERFLHDWTGRHRFREWLLTVEKESVPRLDLLLDLQSFSKMMNCLKISSEALHDVYLGSNSASQVSLPAQQGKLLVENLRTVHTLPLSVDHLQNHLLNSLYHGEFHRFIKSQLIEQAKARLRSIQLEAEDRNGLGECFCLSNPRLKENPIVLISDAFTYVTGYTRQSIIGRNCRFLQGPGTSQQALARIREALKKAEPISELLLNYRRDSMPFWCLVNILPLRDSSGRLVYFIGGQTNVTTSLAKSDGLRYLFGGSADSTVSDPQNCRFGGMEVSPTLAEHLRTNLDAGSNEAKGLIIDGLGDLTSSDSGYGSSNPAMLESVWASGTKDAAANGSSTLDLGAGVNASHTGKPTSTSFFSGRSSRRSVSSEGKGSTSRAMSKNKGRSNVNVAFAHRKPDGNTGVEAESSTSSGQHIPGAEPVPCPRAFSREDQMPYLAGMYSKLLVMRRSDREVILVTEPLLLFLGMAAGGHGASGSSSSSRKEQGNDSALMNADLLSLLCGTNRSATRRIRASVKEGVELGEEFSIMAAVKSRSRPGTHVPSKLGVRAARLWDSIAPRGKGRQTAKRLPSTKWVTIHMTPLKDREGCTYAFVAIFG